MKIHQINNQIIQKEQLLDNLSIYRKNGFKFNHNHFQDQNNYQSQSDYEEDSSEELNDYYLEDQDEFGELLIQQKEQQLRQNLKDKFQIKVENAKIKELEFLSIKQSRQSSNPLSQYLLVAITTDNNILLIDLNGEVQVKYDPGHLIYKWTFQNQGEENLLSTLGYDWDIRHHVISTDSSIIEYEEIKQKKIPEEEKLKVRINPNYPEDINTLKEQEEEIEKQIEVIKKKKTIFSHDLKFESSFNLLEYDFFSNSTEIRNSYNYNRYRKQNQNQTEHELEQQLSPEEKQQKIISRIPFQNYQQNNETDKYVSSFCGYFTKYNKMFLFGDYQGSVHSFYQNGTRHGKGRVSKDPIITIEKHYPQPIYITKNVIGFFNSHTMQISNPQCEESTEKIILLNSEGQHSQAFFVLLNNLDILVYESKNQKQSCSILMKLNGQDEELFGKHPKAEDFQLQTFSNFLLLQNKYNQKAKILNITDFRSKPSELFDDTGFYIDGLKERFLNKPENDDDEEEEKEIINNKNQNSLYVTQKHSSNTAYIVYSQNDGNDTYLSMYELFTESPGFSLNFFENVRFPMILIAVLVLFLIKFCKKDKKDDFGEGSGDFSKSKIDKLISDFSKNEKFSGGSASSTYKKGK